MAGFSKSVWQGQGIPQQTEPNRVPEIMANFGSNLSRGVERWIQASEEKRERQKREAQFAKGTRQALVAMGALSKEEADSMGADALMAYGNQLPQIMAKKQRDQESGLINEMLGFSSTKAVTRDEPRYANMQNPEVLDRIAALREEQGGMGGEMRMGNLEAFLADQRKPNPQPQLFGNPYMSPQSMAGGMQRTTNAWQMGIANPPVNFPRPEPSQFIRRPQEEMVGPSNEMLAASARQDLARFGQINKEIANLEGQKTRQVQIGSNKVKEEVPLTEAEYKAQLGGIAEKYPMAAGLLQKFITGKELSVSDQLAMRKEIREDAARTIPGVGQFATVSHADKFRETYNDARSAVSGLNRLIEIQGMGDKFFNQDIRREAENLARMVRGALRLKLIGPGAVTEHEQKVLESIVTNPTRIFQNPFGKESSLRTVLNKIKKATIDEAGSYGLKVDDSIFGGQANQGPKRMTFNTSTGKVE